MGAYKHLLQAAPVRFFLRVLQVAAIAGVLYFIAQELAGIGWAEVGAALPTSPWYYLFFLLWYFALPIGEWKAYQVIWGPEVKEKFGIFVRMRVFNLALISYAGEAFLAVWANKNLKHDGKAIVSAIKDSTIISSVASNSFTVAMLAGFFFTGQLALLTSAGDDFDLAIGLSLAAGLIVVPVVIKYHSKILALDVARSKRVFIIHLIRLVAILLLQAAQWAVVLPEVPFDTWLLLLTAQMVLTRVPFLPNTDLLFAGLGITLMGFIEGPEAKIAAMFLAAGALSQVLNLLCFIFTSFNKKPKLPSDATQNTA
ncbi:MAG: hypothetical protein JKY60_17720 [Kordiimonadaceae bacterium]|nr:hypothetical protein [Kordiimonadaceae bacterium]